MSLDAPSSELTIRLAAALSIFAVMAAWEMARGLLAPRIPRGPRWLANVGLVAVDTALVRLILPAGLVGAAWWVEERGWGLLPDLGLHRLVAAAIAVVALDLVVYVQHVLFHAVPLLWRFHRVHHADHDVDVTTGLRFHPVEIVLSLGLKLLLVAALGTPAEAVLLFEVLLNGTSIFNHANVGLPVGIDRALRLILVTPDMHRVHHSVEPGEHNSNFGFNLTWWDRLFGTYRVEAAVGRDQVQVGLREIGAPRLQTLSWMLLLPFARQRDRGPGAPPVEN